MCVGFPPPGIASSRTQQGRNLTSRHSILAAIVQAYSWWVEQSTPFVFYVKSFSKMYPIKRQDCDR